MKVSIVTIDGFMLVYRSDNLIVAFAHFEDFDVENLFFLN